MNLAPRKFFVFFFVHAEAAGKRRRATRKKKKLFRLIAVRNLLKANKTRFPEMGDFLRRTEILRYRQLLIDTISSAFPRKVTLEVLIASARIKIVKDISIQEIKTLIDELVNEGIVCQQKDGSMLFNNATAQLVPNNMTLINTRELSDKELYKLQLEETREQKRLRLIQDA